MTRKISVVLLASVLLVVGSVWAAATKTPVQGEFVFDTPAPAEKTWTDDEGILHVRGLPYVLTSTTGNLVISITGTTNYNQDPAPNGVGDFFGEDTVEVFWGELSGTFRGRHSGTTINGVGYGSHVYQGISGDFVGMKLKLYSEFHFNENIGIYVGDILNPHG